MGRRGLTLVVRHPMVWTVLAAVYLALSLVELRRAEFGWWPLAGYCFSAMTSWWVAIDEGMR
jgi:hypothetical protein